MASIKYKVLESLRHGITLAEHWDNGIIYFRMDEHSEIKLEDSEFQYRYLQSKYDGINKLKILVDPGKFSTITKEAREYSTRPESNSMTKATAVVVNSTAQRLLVNFVINFTQKQTMKMKMFENKDKAVEWLMAV